MLEYTFKELLPPAGTDTEPIVHLLATVLESSVDEVNADLTYQLTRQPVQAWLAFSEGQLVGCKLGYERKPGHYYSWLGGVQPAIRGQGIARELMRQQHAWCQQQGYRRIRTQTYNRWRAMLLLNLHAGFDIVGTVQGSRGLVLVLEKELTA
ncbi:GNAT family N-acetyltransferase [Hymenobacter sp. YC55]|uniref:GNAT family N-acetyltransferase n=1 Tax=Hymenobacter sp. YC55 TaxID=3034019 RepID=UPI0023F81F5C|nr:GNAT family N-acetyltransferase [Hymenobacter sp. YC55]MDF7810142.1 GNAT family N-acetyltransferase [Hymenobacter sp. YC55]